MRRTRSTMHLNTSTRKAAHWPLETSPKNLTADSQVPEPLDVASAPRQSVDSFYSLIITPIRRLRQFQLFPRHLVPPKMLRRNTARIF